ncbi:MAG: 30S ribosomal protein S2 [Candidatus Anstonellaceae archaeon]
MDNFLIKQETYLEAGIHIGTKLKVVDMNQFIYRMRNDGLYVLDLRKIDERIRLAGKLLAQYAPEDILVVASRTYSGNAASVFSELTGIKVLQGRFIPGILTNVHRKDFLEPKLLLICDPKGEKQAVIEAGKMGIATIGLCDSDNSTSFIDWIVPCNNKGRRSLALIFYLLSREYLMGRNKISSYDEFTTPLSKFEAEKAEEDAQSPASETQEMKEDLQTSSKGQSTEEPSPEAAPSADADKKEKKSAKKREKALTTKETKEG